MNGISQVAEAGIDQRIVEHRPEHRRIDLLVGRQLRRRDGVQLVEQALEVRAMPLLRRGVDVREIVERLGVARCIEEIAGFLRVPVA